MPITLAQARELSQEKLTHFVIDEFVKSALLDKMIFDNTVKLQGGKTLAYVYNRMKTQPTAEGRAINTEYTPHEADTQQVTVNLKIFGGSFQVDRVLENAEKQVVSSHIRFQLEQKIKATVALWHDTFINGDSGTDALLFDGLDKAITGSSTELIPASAIDLSSTAAIDANWKVFLDSLRLMRARLNGAPTLYLMNSDMYGKFQSVMDRAGINLTSKTNYGDEVAQWGASLVMSLGDKPGSSNPIIGFDSGDGTTSVYATRIALDGVHAISPEGNKLIRQYLPDMTKPGAVKTGEVEMVAAMAVKATRSAGVLRSIKLD